MDWQRFHLQELKKSSSVRSQLDLYKRQSQELQIKVQEETKRADKAEFEAKRAQEKLQSIIKEKEVGCKNVVQYPILLLKDISFLWLEIWKQCFSLNAFCFALQRLVEERDSLKDINEELRCSQLQQGKSGAFRFLILCGLLLCLCDFLPNASSGREQGIHVIPLPCGNYVAQFHSIGLALSHEPCSL